MFISKSLFSFEGLLFVKVCILTRGDENSMQPSGRPIQTSNFQCTIPVGNRTILKPWNLDSPHPSSWLLQPTPDLVVPTSVLVIRSTPHPLHNNHEMIRAFQVRDGGVGQPMYRQPQHPKHAVSKRQHV